MDLRPSWVGGREGAGGGSAKRPSTTSAFGLRGADHPEPRAAADASTHPRKSVQRHCHSRGDHCPVSERFGAGGGRCQQANGRSCDSEVACATWKKGKLGASSGPIHRHRAAAVLASVRPARRARRRPALTAKQLVARPPRLQRTQYRRPRAAAACPGDSTRNRLPERVCGRVAVGNHAIVARRTAEPEALLGQMRLTRRPQAH